jgi:hypothetical protein
VKATWSCGGSGLVRELDGVGAERDLVEGAARGGHEVVGEHGAGAGEGAAVAGEGEVEGLDGLGVGVLLAQQRVARAEGLAVAT